MSIIRATIRSTGNNNYNRIGISRKDKKEFSGLNNVKIIYGKDSINAKLDGKLFLNWTEIDDKKIQQWSRGRHSKIELDINNLKKGEMEIIKIVPAKNF